MVPTMNYLWCDMWEYRKDELLSMNSSQLATILEMTLEIELTYQHWRKDASDELISILLKGLTLDDTNLMKKTIEAADILT